MGRFEELGCLEELGGWRSAGRLIKCGGLKEKGD